jgi:hypothetical protein
LIRKNEYRLAVAKFLELTIGLIANLYLTILYNNNFYHHQHLLYLQLTLVSSSLTVWDLMSKPTV